MLQIESTEHKEAQDAELAQKVQAFQNRRKGESPMQQGATTQPWSPELVTYLTTSMLIFGVLVLAMMTFLIARGKAIKAILPSFGVVLIIVSGVVVIMVGYNEVQIASLIGLLGTVAGYLLGQESRSHRTDAADASKKRPTGVTEND